MDPDEIGRLVRLERRQQNLKQAELASLAGVGTRFVSELENGKTSLELGRVIKVLETIGLDLTIHTRAANWSVSDYVP